MCCCDTAEFMIIALVVVSLAIPLQVFGKTLEDEFKDFCDIMPKNEIRKLTEIHLRNDKEFNEAVIFLQSNTWAMMLKDVQQNKEWIQLKDFMNQSGLNIDKVLKSLFDFVADLEPVRNNETTKRNLRAFFDDVETIFPIGKLLAILHEKKQNSTLFKEFYNKVSSHEVHKMFENVRKQPVVRRVLVELKSMGARIDETFQLFYGFMNWDSPLPLVKRKIPAGTSSLEEDLEDFKQLVPWSILKNISDEHLSNDEELVKIISYLKGPDFEKLIRAVKLRREYRDLKEYLENSGIDIEILIEFLYDLIINADSGGRGEVRSRRVRNFQNYLDEIETAIPVAKMLTVFNDKMEHNEAFKDFIKKISDSKVRTMVDDLRATQESRELFEKLQELGMRIREFFILLYAFLGWGSPLEKSPDIIE